MATAPTPYSGAPSGRSFRRWRRGRPFWGGLLLILSGLELFLSGNLNPTSIQVHVGPTGFLSYVIPVGMLLCGVLTWLSPNQRLFYGILASLIAVYSLIGVNFGGFFIGMLLGIIGGALVVAWSPTPTAAAAPERPAGEAVDQPGDASPGWFLDEHTAGQPQQPEPAPDGDSGYSAPREAAQPERSLAGNDHHGGDGQHDDDTPRGGGYRGRLLAITLVPVTLAAAVLLAVDNGTPAFASPCPVPTGAAPRGSPTPPTSGLPCPGPGVVKSAKADPGQPVVSATLATLTGSSLSMSQSQYQGVAELPTVTGQIRALKFTMNSAVTKQFELRVAEPNGGTTVIKSPQLTAAGNVSFFMSRFTGKLSGLIPVTFTPDAPPPPTFGLPLFFTDVTIQLAYVHCDTLTGLQLSNPPGSGFRVGEA